MASTVGTPICGRIGRKSSAEKRRSIDETNRSGCRRRSRRRIATQQAQATVCLSRRSRYRAFLGSGRCGISSPCLYIPTTLLVGISSPCFCLYPVPTLLSS
ncbi:unnamed protein product [Sphagnum jensenii]